MKQIKQLTRKKNHKEEVEVKKESASELDDKTVTELRNMAKEAGIKGYSTMKKDELIDALN